MRAERRRVGDVHARRRGGVGRLRQAEVEDLHRAVGTDLDVGRLQIAVHDALLVRDLERKGYLPRDAQRFVEGQTSAGRGGVRQAKLARGRRGRAGRLARRSVDDLRQRRALDQLHHQRVNHRSATCRRRVFEAVDLRDVGVVERREHVRLAPEPREPIGRVGNERRQHLQRDIAAELGVAGAVDLAHAPGPQVAEDFVWTQPSTNRQCHPVRGLPGVPHHSAKGGAAQPLGG